MVQALGLDRIDSSAAREAREEAEEAARQRLVLRLTEGLATALFGKRAPLKGEDPFQRFANQYPNYEIIECDSAEALDREVAQFGANKSDDIFVYHPHRERSTGDIYLYNKFKGLYQITD